MSKHIAITHPVEYDKATTITKNIAHMVTCSMAVEAIRDATNSLLLSPDERAALDQAITVLEVSRAHYTKLTERLASYG